MSVITELLQRFRMLAGGARVTRFGDDLNAIAHLYTASRGTTTEVRWLFHLPPGQVDDFLKHWATRNGLGENYLATMGVNATALKTITQGTAAQNTLVEGGLRAVRVLDDYPAVAHTGFAMVRDGERVMIDMAFPAAIGGGYSGVRANLMQYIAGRIRDLGGQALSPNLVNLLGGGGQTFRPVAPTLR